MKVSAAISGVLVLGLFAATAGAADARTPEEDYNRRLYGACENIRAGDPGIRIPAIKELFKLRGLVAYRILYLEWIAEGDPKIRGVILAGFKRVGDHRHIPATFPEDWLRVAGRFPQQERERRIAELWKYFPEEMRSAAKRVEPAR